MKTRMLRNLLLLFVVLFSSQAHSQVKIGDNTTFINPSSLLELESTTKGLLLPRLTNEQIKAMTNVPTGMLLFSITDSALYLYKDTGWAILELRAAGSTGQGWTRNGSNLSTTAGVTNVGIGLPNPYGQLSNTNVNLLDYEGYGGSINSTFAWQSNDGEGYAAQIANLSTRGSRGLLIRTNDSGTVQNALEIDASYGNKLVNLFNVHNAGNVGIGISAPTAKLHVVGINPLTLNGVQTGTTTSADSLLTINNGMVQKLPVSTFSSPSSEGWARNSGNVSTAADVTKVGIGTPNPYGQLSNTAENVLDNEGYGGNVNSTFAWQSSGDGYAAQVTNTLTNGGRGLLVKTSNRRSDENALEINAANNNLLNVLNSGNVGIGNAYPQAKLDVNGDIHYSGTLNMGIIDSVVNYNAPGFNSQSSISVGCPTGYTLIGGGGGHRDFNDAQKNLIVNFSGPDPNNLNRWRVLVTNTSVGNEPRAIQAYAICAKVK